MAGGGRLTTDLAPRSVALYHALDSELFRGGHGIMTPDAEICVEQARELFHRSKSQDDGECVVWLDGVTGLPVKLQVVSVPDEVGGSIGLAPEGTTFLVSVTGERMVEAAAAEKQTVEPPLLREKEALPGLREWIQSLPDSTGISYTAGAKARGSKSGERYAAYQKVKTLGAYRGKQKKGDAWRDLKYDLEHDFATLSPETWAGRISAVGVGDLEADAFSDVFKWPQEQAAAVGGGMSLADIAEYMASQASYDHIGGDIKPVAAIEMDRREAKSRHLADHDATMRETVRIEALEDGPISPAIVGGLVTEALEAEGVAEYRIHALTAAAPKLQNMKQLRAHPSWGTPGGFKEKLQEELEHVIGVKKALILVPGLEYARNKKEYGERCEIKNILTPATEKLMANGEHARNKVRMVLADIKGVFQIDRTFSATVNDETVRFLESLTLGREDAERHILDVKGAYFEGKVPTPEQGGRVLFAPVPEGWGEFGYPERDSSGNRNFFKVVGNVPGRQDAGVIWQDEYDAWLFAQDFNQSVVDRRVFYKTIEKAKGGEGLFIIGVFVDDNWTHSECPVAWADFKEKWSARFMPSLNNDLEGRDFCGVSYADMPDGSVELACGKLLASLEEMVEDDIEGMRYETPMTAESLSAIRTRATKSNPLLGEEFVARARRILGLILYVVRCARPDSAFAAVALSQQIGVNLTKPVWDALLRLSCYLVRTPEKRLIYRPHWGGGQVDFVCNCDSSCINMPTDATSFGEDKAEDSGLGPMGASMGGFACYFPDSGAFQWDVFSPRKLALSSAGSELTMASWAGKSIIMWRMMMAELKLLPAGPTVLEMDASAVLDGVKMERVTRLQRYQSARLAVLRMWVKDRVLRFRKTRSADMRADALSKPVQPAQLFNRLASLLLTGRESE